MSGIYWLASYPKFGNTWFRAFLHHLRNDLDRPADINELTTGACASSRGWIDDVLGFDSADLGADEVEQLRPAEPKYSKIHDAYTFTFDGEPLVSRAATRGALYIIRNPLDVVFSAANHWNITIDEALARMGQENSAVAKGRRGLPSQVRQRLLSWSRHVFSGFEELSRQESQGWFRERPGRAKEPFFRCGRAGGWRETLTDAQVAQIIDDHGPVMGRFGYLDGNGHPVSK